MDFKKDDIYSLLGTLVFHLVILLILWFTVLKTVVPEEEEGVLVNFGNLNAATGTFEPRYTGEIIPQPTTPPPPSSPSSETPQEELVTQDLEESISLANAKKEEERKREEERRRQEDIERERIRREEAERQRLAEEQKRVNALMAGSFAKENTESTSQGDAAQGKGNQGSPFGNSDRGENEGVGGYGSFNLNGRSIGAGGLPRPDYTIQEEGRIVISITVDPRGNVIFAEIGRGTNIANESMRKSAIEAALKAKFNSINETNNQSGTITYLYKLL